jgi:putative membrane protein
MGILIGIVCNAVALYVTTLLVPGIAFTGNLGTLLLGGLILGIFNLIVRPIAMFLALPLLIVTLGLFYFVLNGLLLWLAAAFLPGYSVNGLVPGIVGALVMTIANWILHLLFGKDKKKD